MSTQHTPGPWIVECGAVYTADHIPVAAMDREIGNGTTPVERDANARLIAASPDLLAVLKAAPLPTVVGTAFREWYYGERKAAIKEAEEGQP